MFDAVMQFLAKAIDAGQLGGWVRAGVGVLLGSMAVWFGGVLGPLLSEDFKAAFALVAATIVVGVWQMLAKKYLPVPAPGPVLPATDVRVVAPELAPPTVPPQP